MICDNCTDNTAEIARSLGVYAYERRNPNLRGKGYAIEWMLKELWKLPRSYDAIVMFDADNLVNPDYLTHMNNDLCNGSRVIQAYLDTKKTLTIPGSPPLTPSLTGIATVYGSCRARS